MTFQNWLEKIEAHLFRAKILGKKFKLPNEDIVFEVEISKSRYNEYFACLFSISNTQVSELASDIFGRSMEYRLVNESLNSIVNGKVGGYLLTEFSSAERKRFYEHIATQASSIFQDNSNLRRYFERARESVESGFIRKSGLPLENLQLAMVAFVLGEEWNHYIERAATSKIEGFNANARRLGDMLQSRSR